MLRGVDVERAEAVRDDAGLAGAVVAAGSTITQDVPVDALSISRTAQVNREGWAARRRALATMVAPLSVPPSGAKSKPTKAVKASKNKKEKTQLVSAGGRGSRQGGKR